MSKNFVCGVGVLGLVGLAVYIYKEHKKAKEQEPESLIYLDDYIAGEENGEGSDEQDTKQEQKSSFSAKVSKVCSRIGKAVGTAVLKFGAKHPKAAQFILRFGRYIPFFIIGMMISIELLFSGSAAKKTQEETSTYYEGPVNDDRFEAPLRMATRDVDPEKTLEVWQNTDLSSNYQKLQELLRTMNLAYSEHYEIDDKESFKNSHPDWDFTDVKDDFILSQRFCVQDVIDHQKPVNA